VVVAPGGVPWWCPLVVSPGGVPWWWPLVVAPGGGWMQLEAPGNGRSRRWRAIIDVITGKESNGMA